MLRKSYAIVDHQVHCHHISHHTALHITYIYRHNNLFNALQFLQEGARIQAQLTLSLTTLAKTKEKYEKVSVSNVNKYESRKDEKF